MTDPRPDDGLDVGLPCLCGYREGHMTGVRSRCPAADRPAVRAWADDLRADRDRLAEENESLRQANRVLRKQTTPPKRRVQP